MPALARLEHAIMVAIEPLEQHLAERRARRHRFDTDADLRTRGWPAVGLSGSSSNQQSHEKNRELHVVMTAARPRMLKKHFASSR